MRLRCEAPAALPCRFWVYNGLDLALHQLFYDLVTSLQRPPNFSSGAVFVLKPMGSVFATSFNGEKTGGFGLRH